MEFKLLGPVEVVIDGKSISITSRRQEIVLALLLLEANNTVSVDRLVDALWDRNPPATARTQVYFLVSALRRLIGGEVIVTRPPGYAIEVADQDIDLALFKSLAASGSSAAAQRSMAEAVQYLRSALALWRGPVAGGVESEVIRANAMRLHEQRMAIIQACLDCELQMGRHRELIGELSELVVEYPLNERFRGQLMLALYRAGRQADALEVFQAGREILREQLGLDPAEALCSLQRSILTRRPGIDLPENEHLGINQQFATQQAEISALRNRLTRLERMFLAWAGITDASLELTKAAAPIARVGEPPEADVGRLREAGSRPRHLRSFGS
jgi:DNA-binding SARP family transcriptional activator